MTRPSKNINPRYLNQDIQGLRAIAVLAVIFFHIFPSQVTGGFVGVDVFFVISGYLITGLLYREAQASGKINILNFYTRRIRRLLPAALLVIMTVLCGITFIPKVQWIDLYKDSAACLLYVQNWWLAHQSVDYLAEDSAYSPLRHFWSLAVEEQYYIVWPIVILLTNQITPVFQRQTQKAFCYLLVSVLLISLSYSIYATATHPSFAYFATTVRAWELAIGGLLALMISHLKFNSAGHQSLISWLGIILIILSILFFNEATAFPSYNALLPTLGAALVIWAGNAAGSRYSNRILAHRGLQYLGDLSYSLYLWHWPVLVYLNYLSIVQKGSWTYALLIIGFSILLSDLTKRWVEDPFRTGQWKRWNFLHAPLTLLSLSISMLLALLLMIFLTAKNPHDDKVYSREELKQYAQQSVVSADDIIPALAYAKKDLPDVYLKGCHNNQSEVEPKSCNFGLAQASHTMILVGDSHAAQWLPTLQDLIKNNPDWKLITFTKSACPFISAKVTLGKERQFYASCEQWNEKVDARIQSLQPDLIVTSMRNTHHVLGVEEADATYAALLIGLVHKWQRLADISGKIVIIRDTPSMNFNVPECLSAYHASPVTCYTSRADAIKPDPLIEAYQRLHASHTNFHLIDLTNQICNSDTCFSTQGRLLIWRDNHHLSATYARFLSEAFEKQLISQQININNHN